MFFELRASLTFGLDVVRCAGWVGRQWPVYLVAVPCFVGLWSFEVRRALGKDTDSVAAYADEERSKSAGEPWVNLEEIRESLTQVMNDDVNANDEYSRALRLALGTAAAAHVGGLWRALSVGKPPPLTPTSRSTPAAYAAQVLRRSCVSRRFACLTRLCDGCRVLSRTGSVPRGDGRRLRRLVRGDVGELRMGCR